ncbi:alpha/beta hydrolase [Halobacteria archaeon HArc-gm2]|nr:alpha/beta hydrolase [Halobacteria archaeon HArc-gm2]
MSDAIHADQPTRTAGATLEDADAAVVMFHGRGATGQSVLSFADEFDHDGVAYVAPQAARNTWYPQSFMAPMEQNEPWLSAALDRADQAVADVEDAGIPAENIVLLGFSQGACLASETMARNARRYGGLAALSGGLIGPEGTPREYEGSLDETPVFIGCSDQDPHIPLERVHETAEVLEDLDGDVDERIYEGMGHTVNEDELAAVDEMIGPLGESV